ncbi:MAG TPA: hypothetical protein VIL18_09025 [Longimicrobiales bacterium]|jgi:hypothetical protein
MSTRSIASVALAYVFGLILGAGDALAQDARLKKRLDPQTAAAVGALVDSAGALGLPTEPLVQKALEGQSKGASGEAIVGAVRALIRDLATARDALGDDVDVDALRLAAAALAAGATPAQLERLRPHRSREAFAGGLAGLVYLMSRGVPADKSVDLITAMLDARLSAAEFVSLQRLVERDMMAGAPAAEAATVRAQALIRHGRVAGPGGGVRP